MSNEAGLLQLNFVYDVRTGKARPNTIDSIHPVKWKHFDDVCSSML